MRSSVIDENRNIIDRFKNKSEYYREMKVKYNIGQSFLEGWIKTKRVYLNPKKHERFRPLEKKRVLYYDEFIAENV